MTKKKMKQLLFKLEAISMNPEISKMFLHAVKHCEANKIHSMDIVLTKHIYPELAQEFETTDNAIRVKLGRELGFIWESKANRVAYVKQFKNNTKPTVKKMIQLLIQG